MDDAYTLIGESEGGCSSNPFDQPPPPGQCRIQFNQGGLQVSWQSCCGF